jgi:mediator of RNA polymerase II transcription subunit 13
MFLTLKGSLFRIPSPFIRIRRNDALWDVLPPAVTFWNTLGLAPTCGPKNIISYAIFPSHEGLAEATMQFVGDLSLCYESCKLGTHTRGDYLLGYNDGVIPWEIPEDGAAESCDAALKSVCAKMGVELSELAIEKYTNEPTVTANVDSLVIYMIDDGECPTSISAIAAGFWVLLNTYSSSCSSVVQSRIPPNLVLQVIPKSLVLENGGVVILANDKLQTLARHVYDKCPKSKPSQDALDLTICSNASIRLADTLPRKIPFELVVEAPSNVMLDNSQLHVAYSKSASGNWITAAFTDNTGRNQTVISYCMSGNRTFREVATEIWQTAIQIMQERRVNWRLCIARAGIMGMEELETWTGLANPQQQLQLIVVITSVEIDPDIMLTLPIIASSTAALANKPNTQTPVATPAPHGSPDTIAQTPTGTPSESMASDPASDPDSNLVDITDSTWSIILAQRLMLSSGPNDYQLSLSSGLIMKLPPATPTTNPFNVAEQVDTTNVNCLNVHLHWARHSGKIQETGMAPTSAMFQLSKVSADTILREYLGLFRNLALLAKVRGMSDWMGGVVPWHVLAAQRAADGLDRVYGFQRWAGHS